MAGVDRAQLQQWFSAVDVDGSGKITSTELQKALAPSGLNFSLAVIGQMIRLHDPDNSGSISFEEFGALHAFLTNMRASFQHFDRDRSGELDHNEVHQSLTHVGYELDQHSFYATVKAFDPDKNGKLGEPEYIAMALFLQSARGVFKSFDSQKTGSITLTLSQFVYAAANTR
eukprot:CAMPEP_0177772020 /NCGR_PEP_ID=MMETSP0491_2-20121128/11969_1 /TAXON_ID=63592 /ORGANISM="Tetraselmis chuii, Strain PLY429" /LENGTH=171 /DNA_ID=CAMNT_0019289741 /DNA_START=243 /DNA_END=758 /DNA_ORIENTATION=-